MPKRLRITILYPMPLREDFDKLIQSEAESRQGEFIGSGCDGRTRDLVFDFAPGVDSPIWEFMSEMMSWSFGAGVVSID